MPTSPPNLVNNLSENEWIASVFRNPRWGCRHFGFRTPGVSRFRRCSASIFRISRWRPCRLPDTCVFLCHRCVCIESFNITSKYGEISRKCENSVSFSKLKMAAAAILDSGHQAFLIIAYMCCYSKLQHFYQIWWIVVENAWIVISYSKFKMAAVAMLDASYLTVFDSIDVLSFKVATLLPILVKRGKQMPQQHAFDIWYSWFELI